MADWRMMEEYFPSALDGTTLPQDSAVGVPDADPWEDESLEEALIRKQRELEELEALQREEYM